MPDILSGERGNWERELQQLANRRARSSRAAQLTECLCFVRKAFERIMCYTFISHTKIWSVFGTGWSTNSSLAWKLTKLAKFILVLIYSSDAEKIRNVREQNFEGDETNDKQLDKEDTQRSDLNSRYLSVNLVFNILTLLFAFVVFNSVLQSTIWYFDTKHE